MFSIEELIGFGATLCTITSFVPQVLKIVREREAEQVSLRMYMITVTGFALWLTYGFLKESVPLMLANGASLVLAATILFLKFFYARKAATA